MGEHQEITDDNHEESWDQARFWVGAQARPDASQPYKPAMYADPRRLRFPMLVAAVVIIGAVAWLAVVPSGEPEEYAAPGQAESSAEVAGAGLQPMAVPTSEPSPSAAPETTPPPLAPDQTASSPLAGQNAPPPAPGAKTSSKPPAPRQEPTNAPPPAPVAGKAFVGHQSNKCLRANASDGSPIQLWTCDGSASQKWVIKSDGTIRSGGLCMDAAWASTANGTTVQLANCNGGIAQQFRFNSSNDIVGLQATRCLDVRNSATANGSTVQLWDCSGRDNQKWSYV